MDEYKWVVYLIIGLIYFFARSKKKNQQQKENESQQPQPQAPSSKPISFEDLLKEIQASKAPKQPEPEPVKRAPDLKPYYEPPTYDKYEEYDDYLKGEKKPLEDTDYDYRKKDSIYDVYEKAKVAAFQKASLEETMKVEDTIVRFGQFKEYQKQEVPSLASLVAKDFENPENIRKAFVMSEILKRKY